MKKRSVELNRTVKTGRSKPTGAAKRCPVPEHLKDENYWRKHTLKLYLHVEVVTKTRMR